MKITRKLAAAALMGLALFATPLAGTSPAHADTVIRLASSTNTRSVSVAVAKPTTFRTDATFAEIVVGDPEVATVSPLTDRSFYVVGVRQGTTGIAIYNEARELVGSLEIEVGPDTDNLNRALKENLAGSDIKAKSANGRVVLSGKAKSPVAASKAKAIAEKFDKEMVNNVKVEASTQVQLEVRFIEAQRSSGKELGISLGGGNSRWSGATGGAVANSSGIIGATNALVSGSTPFGQVLGNLISHGANVDILIQALEERGVARRLAEPNLVALSGDTASFLAGGEFPVPVGTGDNDVKIEFKKFGVGLEFTPTVLDDGLINMRISPKSARSTPRTPSASAIAESRFRASSSAAHRPPSNFATGRASSWRACCRTPATTTSASSPGLVICRSSEPCSAPPRIARTRPISSSSSHLTSSSPMPRTSRNRQRLWMHPQLPTMPTCSLRVRPKYRAHSCASWPRPTMAPCQPVTSSISERRRKLKCTRPFFWLFPFFRSQRLPDASSSRKRTI